MARMKKPENETPEQTEVRRVLETVSNHATRSEKTAWMRKRKNMETLVQTLAPLEDNMLELMAKMQPIYDEIAESRANMVKDCIHPYDLLVYKGTNTVECKFCCIVLVIPSEFGQIEKEQ